MALKGIPSTAFKAHSAFTATLFLTIAFSNSIILLFADPATASESSHLMATQSMKPSIPFSTSSSFDPLDHFATCVHKELTDFKRLFTQYCFTTPFSFHL